MKYLKKKKQKNKAFIPLLSAASCPELGFFSSVVLKKHFFKLLAVLGLCCCTRVFSSRSDPGLLSSCSTQDAHCGGFSGCGAQALGCTGFSSCGSRTPGHRLSSCGTRAQLL